MMVHLEREVEEELEAFARRTGQGSSDVARIAIQDYLRRQEPESELRRQAREVAALERTSPDLRDEIAGLDAMAWRTIRDLD